MERLAIAYRVELGERFMARDTFRAISAHPIMPNRMGLLSAAIFLKNLLVPEAEWIRLSKCCFYRRKFQITRFFLMGSNFVKPNGDSISIS